MTSTRTALLTAISGMYAATFNPRNGKLYYKKKSHGEDKERMQLAEEKRQRRQKRNLKNANGS